MKSSKYLFDTNILVFAQDSTDSRLQVAQDWHEKVANKEIRGFITVQNLLELFAVLTSSPQIENKLTATQALKVINEYRNQTEFHLLIPTDESFDILLKLLEQNKNCRGKLIFDLQLAATALSFGINQIITDDDKGFSILPKITTINPFLAH